MEWNVEYHFNKLIEKIIMRFLDFESKCDWYLPTYRQIKNSVKKRGIASLLFRYSFYVLHDDGQLKASSYHHSTSRYIFQIHFYANQYENKMFNIQYSIGMEFSS